MVGKKNKGTAKEYTGELRVSGEIDLSQFWPGGKSDADTVTVKATKFEFSSDPSKKLFKPTTAFQGASIGTSKGKPQLVIRKDGKITIRLQGIDATELHYKEYGKGGLKGNVEYRQPLAETATTKLHDLLASSGSGKVSCTVTTRVDLPNQVFDKFRRFVGDISVTIGSAKINLNHWLVEQGWAFPAFYNTMRNDEINAILKLAKNAKQAAGAQKRVWGQLRAHVGAINQRMKYRSHGKPNPVGDIGRVVIPKLFRRRVNFTIDTINNLTSDTFPVYLGKLKDDRWVKTAAFLKNRGTKPNISLEPPLNTSSDFQAKPEDLVISEKGTSPLVGPTGKKVTAWS
jgi:endonuclease YncB( thermonuclease family)